MKRDIECFADFCRALEETGFTIGGENSEGIFTLCDRFAPCIQWHTEERETDPWEWRIRVLNERDDIAYAKVFFGKSGYIAREWYPLFLSVRRGGLEAQDKYELGLLSHGAWKIYELLSDRGAMPMHMLKLEGGFSRADKAAFDRAVMELQMGMYITICGQQRKHNRWGMEYGWNSTLLSTIEDCFGEDILRQAARIPPEEAREKIKERILQVNPCADARKIEKFIGGGGRR